MDSRISATSGRHGTGSSASHGLTLGNYILKSLG
jgi:hypothetical protein